MKIKESWLRKNAKNIGVGVMATVGSLAMHGEGHTQTVKDNNIKNPIEQTNDSIQTQKLTDSITVLTDSLLTKKKITSIDSSNESGMSNIYVGKIGKYEIEFYDNNKDKKLDGEMDRFSINYEDENGTSFSINYEDENGTSFSINKNFNGLSASAHSFKEQIGFNKMTVGEFESKYAVILGGHHSDEIVYVKNLSNSEIQKVLDDVKIIQLQENLQK